MDADFKLAENEMAGWDKACPWADMADDDPEELSEGRGKRAAHRSALPGTACLSI